MSAALKRQSQKFFFFTNGWEKNNKILALDDSYATSKLLDLYSTASTIQDEAYLAFFFTSPLRYKNGKAKVMTLVLA